MAEKRRWTERCSVVYACSRRLRMHAQRYGTVKETEQMMTKEMMFTAPKLLKTFFQYFKKTFFL